MQRDIRPTRSKAATEKAAPSPVAGALDRLGPGLITGASDDDPSGIGTYSQAGAQFGFTMGWTLLLTFPLMVAIQEICARIGRVTGHGVAGNVSRNFPSSVVTALVGLLFVANTINIAADLGAMADALKLLIGGPSFLYVVMFGAGSVVAQIFMRYERYVALLKWMTLWLFAYVAVLAVVNVPWLEVLKGVAIPRLTWSASAMTMLVAIFGTTISPYLFVWQSSQEAEDSRVDHHKKPLRKTPGEAPQEFHRIALDTVIGMGFSNLIALAIMTAAAAAFHTNGFTAIASSAQAAEALRPIAGPFAELIFALGIIGAGLLAVPVLAGSAAYAIGEARRWPVGLGREFKGAVAFYGVLTLSGAVGIVLNFTPINPIAALYWSAVVNGVLAAPVMVVLMLLVRSSRIMGRLVVTGWLLWLGWLSTALMALCVVGMIVGMFL